MDMNGVFTCQYREHFTNHIDKERIYVVAVSQLPDELQGHLMMNIVVIDDHLDDGTSLMWAYGRDANNRSYDYWGIYSDNILMDFTEYSRRNIAAYKIQSQWALYRQRKAVKCIERSYLSWKERRNNDWNPNTFMGIIDMYLNFIRLNKKEVV